MVKKINYLITRHKNIIKLLLFIIPLNIIIYKFSINGGKVLGNPIEGYTDNIKDPPDGVDVSETINKKVSNYNLSFETDKYEDGLQYNYINWQENRLMIGFKEDSLVSFSGQFEDNGKHIYVNHYKSGELRSFEIEAKNQIIIGQFATNGDLMYYTIKTNQKTYYGEIEQSQYKCGERR